MFVIDKRNKIIITKGDSAAMFVSIVDNDGIEYEIKDSDEVRLTVKKPGGNELFHKIADEDKQITFFPEDTSSLNTGLYIYDIQLTTEDGYIYTIIPANYLQITEEVS